MKTMLIFFWILFSAISAAADRSSCTIQTSVTVIERREVEVEGKKVEVVVPPESTVEVLGGTVRVVNKF